MTTVWPDIPYAPWRETCTALHLYMQIVGKYRLARTPWINHSWHATFYVTARGFTTSLVPDAPGGVEIVFDLLDHAVIGTTTEGRTGRFSLGPMSVARFHELCLELIRSLGATPELHGRPNEVPDPVPFAEDRARRPYDADAVTRFFRAPDGFANAHVAPDEAYYDKTLSEFLLPYDAVRRSSEPEAMLMAFLDSTYRAAADLGGWDREMLECAPGEPRRPRPLATAMSRGRSA